MSLEQVEFVRGNTLKLAENLNSDHLQTIPEGFNNNILWNLGHIYVVHENLVFKASGEDTLIPEGFAEHFAPKTSPKDWGDAVPSFETVVEKLKEQAERMTTTFSGKLDVTIPKALQFPTFEMTTNGDLLHFGMVHEAMHTTTSKLYNQLLRK